MKERKTQMENRPLVFQSFFCFFFQTSCNRVVFSMHQQHGKINMATSFWKPKGGGAMLEFFWRMRKQNMKRQQKKVFTVRIFFWRNSGYDTRQKASKSNIVITFSFRCPIKNAVKSWNLLNQKEKKKKMSAYETRPRMLQCRSGTGWWASRDDETTKEAKWAPADPWFQIIIIIIIFLKKRKTSRNNNPIWIPAKRSNICNRPL